VLRYLLQGSIQRAAGNSFPLGTIAVNMLGCAAIGFLAVVLAGSAPLRDEYRAALMTGVLGGFTTFSAFGLDTYNLAQGGQLRLAVANVAISCLGGVAAVWLGFFFAERWLGS
jgi:CrcB protein